MSRYKTAVYHWDMLISSTLNGTCMSSETGEVDIENDDQISILPLRYTYDAGKMACTHGDRTNSATVDGRCA